MGEDRIRHLLTKLLQSGATGYFWNPSKTLRDLGMSPEALGTDAAIATRRAVELNNLADDLRRGRRPGSNGQEPGTFAALCEAYRSSEEFADLKPRTQRDYTYYLAKIEAEFGHLPVLSLTAPVIKAYYKRVRREISVTWAYHILGTWRAVLSWGTSEGWAAANPAKDVKIKAPQKRKVIWTPEQSAVYVAKATELGWHSIAAMALVFDSIGQSPIDVRTLRRKAYDGRRIDVTRSKTGNTDAPIPLFPEARKALDAYLKASPKLPDAPLFTNDQIGGEWNESTLQKKHRIIRKAAGLPDYLQLQDFRTTAATEAGASSGTVDEIRALQRHSTRSAGEHYVIPDERHVESVQGKRLATRTKREKMSE